MYKTIIAAIGILGLLFGFGLMDNTPASILETAKVKEDRFKSYAKEARTFISNNKEYNDKVAFLIDMKILSGKNRFFIYDLTSGNVTDKGLVAHGSGSETAVYGKLKFSNIDNSLCTALGKYSIGKSYVGKFGKAYKLYGLDKTNNNAYVRNIVLHKYDDMPYEEQTDPICNSYGCPMVNEKFYDRIQKIIDNSDKKILLYIYY